MGKLPKIKRRFKSEDSKSDKSLLKLEEMKSKLDKISKILDVYVSQLEDKPSCEDKPSFEDKPSYPKGHKYPEGHKRGQEPDREKLDSKKQR